MAKPELTNTQDTPIQGIAEDRLERGPFSSLVASALLAPNPNGATVIGLTGPWGTGKTSVAAMVVEMVGDKATMVRFEPWMVSSKEALTREFFTTLIQAVRPRRDTKESKAARARLWHYASKVMGVVEVGAKAIGTMTPVAALASMSAKSIGKIFKLTGEGLDAMVSEPTLRSARHKIEEDFKELSKPLVVVIDDLDRLDREEIRTTFQLIKACSDFPNVRYLLLYDRSQVVNSLTGSVNDPEAFLEKIVGQSFDLPMATSKQRSELLDEALDELGLHENLTRDASDRVGLVFDNVLLPGLTTVRNVKRYINTVRSLLPGVVVDGFRNVDPADFFAMEFLRQQAPSIYAVLRDEEAPNPGGRVARMTSDSKWEEKLKERRKTAIEALDEPKRSLTHAAFQLIEYGLNSESGALSDRRFGTDYWKPVYLGFCDARATVRESDWSAFKRTVDSSDMDLAGWLKGWDDRESRDRWVTAITSRITDLTTKQRTRLLSTLFKWGDGRTYEQARLFNGLHMAWHEAVRFCSESILQSLDGGPEMTAAVKTVIDSSKAVVGPARVVGLELERLRKEKYPTWSVNCDLTVLADGLRSNLTQLVESEKVWQLRDPHEALISWHYLVGPETFDAWLAQFISTQKGVAIYLNKFLGARSQDVNPLDWPIEPATLEAIEKVDVALLDENGLWARSRYVEGAKNASHFSTPKYPVTEC